MNDRLKFKIYSKTEKKMMLFNNPTLIDGDILEGGLLFKNYDHKITNVGEVNPNDLVILFSTGFTDKNKDVIFDGDILSFHNDKDDRAEVKYGDYLPVDMEEEMQCNTPIIGYYLRKIKTREIDNLEPICWNVQMLQSLLNRAEVEVIGNVYENPELLESEE